MKVYVITEAQLEMAIRTAHEASWAAKSYCMYEDAEEYEEFAKELEYQGIATENFVFDDKLRDKFVLELFKVGKYLDILEATLSQYSENDAKEMLGEIWQCRDYMEVLLRQK